MMDDLAAHGSLLGSVPASQLRLPAGSFLECSSLAAAFSSLKLASAFPLPLCRCGPCLSRAFFARGSAFSRYTPCLALTRVDQSMRSLLRKALLVSLAIVSGLTAVNQTRSNDTRGKAGRVQGHARDGSPEPSSHGPRGHGRGFFLASKTVVGSDSKQCPPVDTHRFM